MTPPADNRPEDDRRADEPPPGYGPPAWGPPPEYGPPTGYGPPAWGPPPEIPPPGYGPPPEIPPPPPLLTRFKTRWEQGPVSVGIVMFTVAVWLVHLALSTWAHINTDLTLGDTGSGIHGQPWRLVTPMVVHFGILHIGLNMWALWIIGPPVEKVIGRWIYLASYVACGIGGSILSDVLLKPVLQNGVLVEPISGGASGAIFGLIGILIGNYLVTSQAEKSGRRSVQVWRFNPSAVKSLAIQGVAWIVISSVAIAGIDNWAHIGGAVVGLVIGGSVAWSRTAPATAASG